MRDPTREGFDQISLTPRLQPGDEKAFIAMPTFQRFSDIPQKPFKRFTKIGYGGDHRAEAAVLMKGNPLRYTKRNVTNTRMGIQKRALNSALFLLAAAFSARK